MSFCCVQRHFQRGCLGPFFWGNCPSILHTHFVPLSRLMPAMQITMGGWIMSGAWVIFMLCAYFGFDDPLETRRKRHAADPQLEHPCHLRKLICKC